MVIINGKILTMEEETIECGYIKIEGNKIKEIGSMEFYEKKNCRKETAEPSLAENEERQDYVGISESTKKEEVLDVHGAWVMPGLIEAHAHIGISEEKWGVIADDCNEGTNPVTPFLRAIDAINPMDPAFHEAIEAGITSVMTGPGSANVVGGQFAFLKTQGRCVDHMVIKHPAAMKVAFGENPKTAYGDQGMYPSTRMGTAALLRKTLFEAVQYKNKKENEKLEQEDFELEPWISVLNREIPLKIHAHRADDILTAIRIAEEFDVDMTIDHGTESHLIADEIKKSGFPVIVGPGLSSRSKLEIQNMNFKTNKVLNEAGVLFALTTDHPVSMIQHLPLCAGLAVKHGLPMEEGLKAITIYPARICRVDDRVGSLKVGKDADIAIFSGNPMDIFTKTLYTIIDGKIVYEYKEESCG